MYKTWSSLGDECRGGKNTCSVRTQTAPRRCGPSIKSNRSWALLDKRGDRPRTWILLKKYYKIYIILNIYIYLTHLLHIYKILNT